MATIRDVADAAGVSTATVSRALSGSGHVSEPTRQRVEAVAAAMGYVPNALARGLRGRTTRVVGIVVPQIDHFFYATVAQGVEAAARDAGFRVVLGASLHSPAREGSYRALLAAQRVDGLLICPARDDAGTCPAPGPADPPAVYIDDCPVGAAVDVVHCDNVGGGYLLARHLIGLGHRRIGVVAGRLASIPGGQRLLGYETALEEAGIPRDPDLVRGGRWDADTAERAVRELLDLPDPPTALIAAGAELTEGTMRELRERRLRVPEDIAVAGFDALPMADAVDPFLTVIEQPIAAICRTATELLIGRISGRDSGPPRRIVLPVELVVRRSCGAGDEARSAISSGHDKSASGPRRRRRG